jgi:hypothetical protein
MPPVPPPRYLYRRRRTWWARKAIPADVRQLFAGRKWLLATTSETDPNRAAAVAAPLLVEWQTRIDQARQALKDPLKAEVEKLTNAYRRYRSTALDDAGAALVADVVDFVLERMGGLTPAQRRKALTDARGDVDQAIRTLPYPDQAARTLGTITGTMTPFLAHFDAWKGATHLKGKTLAQTESAIKKFASAVDQPNEQLQGGHVQQWIETLLRPKSGHPLTPVTINRYLSGLRSYWEWMQSHDLIPDDRRPFWNRKINSGQTEVERVEGRRVRFEPREVVCLWRTADREGDPGLAAFVRIAAYTGARREGIAKLTKKSVGSESGIATLHSSEKSGAGVRDVPIHPELAGLIRFLVGDVSSDGFLIRSSDSNKYKIRGDALGKRFTRLKQRMGFDKRHTFHSIRHTVIYLYRRAECPVEIRNQIVGHADDDVGAKYGGHIDMTQKLEWMLKAIEYPST